MNKLVSVFVCGVQKGGTTSLDAYFCDHPELSPARKKEVHFFDNEKLGWEKPDYSILENAYKADDGDMLRFDVTPLYTYWPLAIERIHAYNPAAKLIYLFRDPFDRAWSHWCMEYAREQETLLFSEAIREGRKRLDKLKKHSMRRRTYSYLERGLYGQQVERALKLFPRSQILFLKSENFGLNYKATLQQVADFLEIAPFPDNGPKIKNKRLKITFSHKPTEADLDLVASFVSSDLKRFVELTGLDISNWPTVGRISSLA